MITHLGYYLLMKTLFYSLMRYNIIDTIASSATEVQKLFKEYWDDIISTVEKLLISSPTTQLASASASTSASSDQDTVQDGQAEEVKQYIKYISTNVVSRCYF